MRPISPAGLVKLIETMEANPVGGALCIALVCVLSLGTVIVGLVIGR